MRNFFQLNILLIGLLFCYAGGILCAQESRPNPWAVNLPPKLQKRIEERRKAREAENAAPVVVSASGDTLPMREMPDTMAVNVRQYEIDSYDDLTAPAPTVDLHDPDNVTTEVEYDPSTGTYVLHTRVGDMDIATPFSMSEKEYTTYSGRQAMTRYWHEKNNTGEHGKPKFDITDMKFNIGPADKVFGPGGVQVKLQGSAELKLGFNHTYTDNPALTERARKSNVFDFDAKLQLNVNAKVGTKVAFNMNYNTEASFDFDQQNLKLAYQGDEDEIIKVIEAGNVQLPLKSTLIQGSQSLFGIRTELQFGKLNIQAIATQQRSQSQSVNSKGGAQMTDFEISANSYDENRHFFLGYFFRDHYDDWMKTVPNVASGVVIKRIEVWVTNKRANYEQARNIVAFVDLGEGNDYHISNPNWHATTAGPNDMQPRNSANNLYSAVNNSGVRDIQTSNNVLEPLFGGQLGGTEYEKIESARMLNSGEYVLNSSLGYISLRTALNPDEVLAVAYEYTYRGQTYQVGEFSSDAVEAPQALILKMLKNTTNSPSETKGKGTWDLMMKNVYSLGASQMQSDKFELYIMYRNDSLGTSVQYLPEGEAVRGKQLIKVLGMDRLDIHQNPNPDGKFDYVEGYTVQTSTGRIIFPVLEPFGENLKKAVRNDAVAQKFVYQELYDSTLVIAQEMTEKDKFTIKGKYKGTSGNEISLNAMNVPRGSVKVTAGGATLTENVDYTVDYTMGTVTILNSSIIESGTPVNVTLENQSTFSMQRKSLFGMHAEYTFNPDFSIGATVMHLNEKPLTTKVNTGSEPLSNTIWGANISYKKEFQWLSNLIDKIPWITATQPSSFSINAEVAQLIPGHTKTVSKAGVAYVDDFESTQTSIDVHYPNYWKLSSTPMCDLFPESTRSGEIEYGFNRALLSWYAIDQVLVVPQNNTPSYLTNLDSLSDHRVRVVLEQEIFPYKESLATDNSRMSVLNLSYYPTQRGPYNLDTEGINPDGSLMNPRKRWGGMMRKLDNTDFETANIEYIEFWMMDPFLTNTNPNYEGGSIYFNLGDVSEDILKDGKKSFEHGLPANGSDDNTENTLWGRMPKTSSTVIAFSNESGARQNQDVGLDGLPNEREYTFSTYADYLERLRSKVTDPATIAKWNDDAFSPFNDPAGDNYHFYRGSDYDRERKSILERYKYFNGTEGNSPATENSGESYGTASTLEPDIEDINKDNTVNEYEKYYEYKVDIRRGQMEVGQNFITDKITSRVKLKNGQTVEVDWYQFKIPVRQYTKRYGNIRNFKSIRFMRMYLTDFSEETHLRLATLDLVRGEWRAYNKDLMPAGKTPTTQGTLDVQAVNYEENSSKSPVNYVLPPGITRQTDPGQAQIIQQNEQAMVLRVGNLAPEDAKGVYKNATFDMRNYKKLQMFVHAERLTDEVTPQLNNEDLTCFIRLGSDLQNNYYEYEIPLSLTPAGKYSNESENDRRLVWPDANCFDFPLSVLTSAKRQRNAAKRAGTEGVSNIVPYIVYDDANSSGSSGNRITVMGNPTLGEVQHIMIGIRNRSNQVKSGEIWVNELRLSEYNEEGGWAAMANAQLAVSDIGQVNVAGRLETAGYGSIESNVLTRNMEDQYQISVSTALEAGRLFPEKAKLQIPLYYTYTNNTNAPKYNPLDTDVELSDALDELETKHEKDSLKQLSQTVSQTHNFSASNVRVNIHSKKKNMFYDPANFTISYSYAQQLDRDPEIQKEQEIIHNGSISYSYDFNPKPWEPFKDNDKFNNPHLKFFKEFNLYYLPQSWSVSTDMRRSFSQLRMREFDMSGSTGANVENASFSKEWMWNRQFDIKYNLTKNLKFTLQGATNASVDEAKYTPEIIKEYDLSRDYFDRWRDTVRSSLRHGGTPYSYQQVFTASWNVPLNRFPALDWITANGTYNGTYNWHYIAPLADSGNGTVDLGNEVSSSRTWQVDGQFNFENLYNKSKYLKQVNQRFRVGGNSRSGRPDSKRPFQSKEFSKTISLKAGEPFRLDHRLNSESLNVSFTRNGKKVKLDYKPDGKGGITITSKTDMDDVEVLVATRDPNERSASQKFLDGAVRFLMMIRKAQITYRVSNSLAIDGFNSTPVFMGQQKLGGGNMLAPGVDFALGMFGKNYLEKAQKRGWLASSDSIAKQASAANTEDFNIKISLEPIPGLKIDLTGQRYIASNEVIDYMYEGMPSTFTGSYNITQVAIGTAFQKLGKASNNYHSATYDRFLVLREKMAYRLENSYRGTRYPTNGFMTGDDAKAYASQEYDRSNGGVSRKSADVLVPAFLAAYTGRSLDKVGRNPFLSLKQMMPNWRVTYDGLMAIPWFKKHFQSVTLTHAYTCKYSVGSYTSYSTWVPVMGGKDKTLGFVRDVQTGKPIPSSAYDIGSVTITEQFAPLIGLNMTLKNSLSTKFEYKKQRTLALNVSSTQLIESLSDEFVIGVGYTIKNLSMIVKGKNNRQRKVSNDLKLSADFAYKDIKSLLRKIEEDVTQASSGNKVFSIKIAADYVLSSKINLQAYYERQQTTPLISTSYPVTVSDFGVSIRLMLTR
ncbi:MAG: cell surface protein SprA [Paludibacteraceae bacterium]|nr:cell surface protein SprA [Paludibacteraceae bacterium]